MLKTNCIVEGFCEYPFQRLKFTPEGDVTMCCWHQRKCLGNILRNSLEEIWNGELANEIRQSTSQGVMHKTCRVESCPYFHQKELPLKQIEMKSYPTSFEIDLPTQHCNIGGENPSEKNPACFMCERHLNFQPQKDRLNEVCRAIQPYVRHVNWIHIQGIAEPFWKDRIFEIIDLLGVSQYSDRIGITTTTNGTVMTEKRRRRFLELPISCITWSLDAASPDIYKKVRRVDMYPQIVRNLKAYCQERTSENQWVNIHNNINTVNIGDVVGMVELAAEAGVDQLDFNATYGVPDVCVNEKNFHLFQEAQRKIMEASIRLGVNVTFMRDLVLDFGEAPKWEIVKQRMLPTHALVQLDLTTLQDTNKM